MKLTLRLTHLIQQDSFSMKAGDSNIEPLLAMGLATKNKELSDAFATYLDLTDFGRKVRASGGHFDRDDLPRKPTTSTTVEVRDEPRETADSGESEESPSGEV